MQTKYIALFESFSDSISIKLKKDDGLYQRFNIYAGRRVVGSIEIHRERRTIDISSIVIKDEMRSKGYGVKALVCLLHYYSNYESVETIFADCVSKQSLSTFVRAYGVPEYMGDTYDEYDKLEDAMKTLPDFATIDDDGTINGSGAINVRYDLQDTLIYVKSK